MKRLLPVLPVLVLILSGCQTIPDKYTTFKGMPCHFHDATVCTNNLNATLGSLSKRCCPNSEGYKGKRGQSIEVGRGTPVYAVADMTLVHALNRTAQKNCKVMNRAQAKLGVGSGNCLEPYDDLELMFKDDLGNRILFYHLMSDNPFVPGFGKGDCEVPELFQSEKYKRYPRSCGGVKKRKVKKGELIGFSGATGMQQGGPHISFAIKVKNHPEFPNQSGWIVPANSLTWENIPSNDDDTIYLLPLKKETQSKKDRLSNKSRIHKKDHRNTFCFNENGPNSNIEVYRVSGNCKEGHESISLAEYFRIKELLEEWRKWTS